MLCSYIIFTKCDSVPIRNQHLFHHKNKKKENEEEKNLPTHTHAQNPELVIAQGIEKIILCLNQT